MKKFPLLSIVFVFSFLNIVIAIDIPLEKPTNEYTLGDMLIQEYPAEKVYVIQAPDTNFIVNELSTIDSNVSEGTYKALSPQTPETVLNRLILYAKKSRHRLQYLAVSHPTSTTSAIITFKEPLSEQEIESLKQAYNLDIRSLKFISTEGGGEIPHPIDHEVLNKWQSEIAEWEKVNNNINNFTLVKGYINVKAIVSMNNAFRLANDFNDSKILVVDIGPVDLRENYSNPTIVPTSDTIFYDYNENIQALGKDYVTPAIEILSPVAENYTNVGKLDVFYNVIDNQDPWPKITLILDGADYNEFQLDLGKLSFGNHTLVIEAIDDAENKASNSVYFNLVATLLQNPGFEQGSGIDAYSWQEAQNHTRSSSKSHSGVYSLKASLTGSTKGAATISDRFTVFPNTKYAISAYIYNSLTQGRAYLDVKQYRGANDPSWSCDTLYNYAKNTWSYVSCSFTTPNDVNTIQVRLITDGAPVGTAYFDDIAVAHIPNPVAQYALDNNANDLSGNGNNGTAYNVTYVSGRLNNAAKFNGTNSYVVANDSISLSPTREITVSAWINTDALNQRAAIVWKGGYNYFLHMEGGYLKWIVYDSNNIKHEASFPVQNLKTNTWHHIVGAYSSTAINVYLDGNLMNSSARGASIRDQAGALYIGKRGDSVGTNPYFKGIIDDVRIYDAVVLPSLIAYYPFDNTAPILSGIPDVSTNEDTTLPANWIDLWIYASDVETQDANLTFTIVSESNSTLIDCYISSNRYVNCNMPTANRYGYSDVNVKVTDPQGLYATDALRVTVNSVNDAPTANAGADATAVANVPVTLYGSGTDSDGTIASYSWTLSPLTNCTTSGANTQNYAVNCTTTGTRTATLSVTDNQGAAGSDSAVITVNAATNIAPLAVASASSQQNYYGQGLAKNINDDSNSTYWEGMAYALPGGVALSFTSNATVNSVEINFYSNISFIPSDYKIQYDNDGIFTNGGTVDIVSVTGNTKQIVKYNFSPVTARYFRILMTNTNNSTKNQAYLVISEWRIYGMLG